MISLTKLDNHVIIVSIESIKYLESIPDTLIHFINGDSLIVKESLSDIKNQVFSLQSQIIRQAAHGNQLSR